MHLILAELFVQQASDDTGDLNDAIPGGLDFMVSRGVDSSQSLSDMIGMCAEQLLQERGCRGLGHISAPPRPYLGRTSSPQEMVLRLGRASGERERGVLLLALNLLIPVGLQAPPPPPPPPPPLLPPLLNRALVARPGCRLARSRTAPSHARHSGSDRRSTPPASSAPTRSCRRTSTPTST